MAKVPKLKLRATSEKVEEKKVVEKVVEQPEVSSEKVMLKITNLKLSEKIQKSGLNVSTISGGVLEQPTAHYFNCSLSKVKKMTDKKNQPLLSEDEISEIEEVDTVEPTKEIFTEIKSIVTQGNKVNHQ